MYSNGKYFMDLILSVLVLCETTEGRCTWTENCKGTRVWLQVNLFALSHCAIPWSKGQLFFPGGVGWGEDPCATRTRQSSTWVTSAFSVSFQRAGDTGDGIREVGALALLPLCSSELFSQKSESLVQAAHWFACLQSPPEGLAGEWPSICIV